MISNLFDLHFSLSNIYHFSFSNCGDYGTKENQNLTSLKSFWPKIHFKLQHVRGKQALISFIVYQVYYDQNNTVVLNIHCVLMQAKQNP